jgi:Xaa-Pro aminopeptidase
VFQVGNVLTIEPGLYYPDRGYGVRVEDMVYIDDDGQMVMLTDFHKDLVLPLAE